jgi:hypothetical protein
LGVIVSPALGFRTVYPPRRTPARGRFGLAANYITSAGAPAGGTIEIDLTGKFVNR